MIGFYLSYKLAPPYFHDRGFLGGPYSLWSRSLSSGFQRINGWGTIMKANSICKTGSLQHTLPEIGDYLGVALEA
jgi:hypothetical protein